MRSGWKADGRVAGDTSHHVDIHAIGSSVRIKANRPELAGALREAWAGSLAKVVAGWAPDVVLDGDRAWAESDGTLVGAMELLTQQVTLEAISARAGDLLMLHACSVADPVTCGAVIMVGRSGMGKTTAARTLGARWAYATDETVAIDSNLSLLPYPKPLSILTEGQTRKDQVSPAALGLVQLDRPVTVRAVILLNRRPGTADIVVEKIRTVTAITMLAEHTSYLARFERPLTRLADLLHGTGGLRQVTYAEAADLVPLVEDLLAPPGVDPR